LVAEDDDDLRRAIAVSLRGAALTVDTVADLPEADEALATSHYDCVVLDRMLPSGDAAAYVESHRRAGWSVPTLFLSAMNTVEDRVRGLACADDYLGKPFAMIELVARVRSLCRRADRPRATVIHCGDLEMDLGRREVRRSGVLLSLTFKQFAVLELLMISDGHTVSRSELFAHCWDEHACDNGNALDVTIALLRRKLGPPEVLRTLRGFGYRLEPEK
jgi:DNA-binding response OmpR family regulator